MYQKIVERLTEEPKRWLVTGCAGFIGSNLVETLLKLNQPVLGVDNFATGYQHNVNSIKECVSKEQWKKFSFIQGDIEDYAICDEITKGIDIVLHQAALGSVPRSINDPIRSNNVNVTGFLNMITASKNNGVGRFVYASSSAVYGDSSELPKQEDIMGNLLSPYAVTKYVNEIYMEVFYRCYGFESIGLRYFNVFGKRQAPNGVYAAVMPKWISQILKEKKVFINGDGETSRDFTYIDNVVQANILAGTTTNEMAVARAYNIAAGGRETLNNLYSAIALQLKEKCPELNVKEPIYREFRAGDIRHSNANISLANSFLGYNPTHSLEEGLKESIRWYLENLK